ncbi:hypothetical protein K469DRAFT_721386 [Zopfia rhizophila CBS 207.26]|uniref:Glycine zipper 2TM domain-containing protein n=1 Tax=Zopfia rhizophila CBS 207.26 TaxID=1314779 RepID=A0A6A6EG60_9PEZI|nr:hypothetical protein K469DRAFT_721386 [Zopfia rhizophila CBS 207.26]
MAALAFKALHLGADKIPDKVFESIPGGFFTPSEKKKRKSARDSRHRSEQRYNDRDRRRSRRNRISPTNYSDYSGYDDTEYERDYRDKQRRRAKSLGRSVSPCHRNLSRKRAMNRGRDRDLDGEMDRAERGAEFAPSPSSYYRPYNPADYAPAAAGDEHYDRRASSIRPEYNAYPAQPVAGRPGTAQSSSAARYTPAAGYAPSPVNTSVPPANPGYAPYNPADYASPSQSPRRAPGNSYPSPPPFYRQASHSQPSLAQYPPPDNQLTYLEPPSRHGSTSSSRHHRHGDRKHHRTRSAGHHGRSRSRVTDQLRDRFDNLNLDSQDKKLAASTAGALAGGFAANALGHGTLSTVVGVAISGLGGRELEKRHEK